MRPWLFAIALLVSAGWVLWIVRWSGEGRWFFVGCSVIAFVGCILWARDIWQRR